MGIDEHEFRQFVAQRLSQLFGHRMPSSFDGGLGLVFVEQAIRCYLRTLLRQVRHQRDLEAINARAAITNRGSADLLDLQAWPE